MKFKIEDLRVVELSNDKNYLIKRWEYYDNFELALKDMYRIYGLMKYVKNTNEDYKDISFIIVLSTTGKGKHNCPTRIKVYTKGRPKFKVVGGIKKSPHLHIACFGIKCPSYVEEVTKKLNKTAYKTSVEFYNRKTKSKRLFTYDKLKGDNYGTDYIQYIYNQADKLLTYGTLDFNKMTNDFFIAKYNKNF